MQMCDTKNFCVILNSLTLVRVVILVTRALELLADYIRGLGGDQLTALLIFIVFILIAKRIAQGVASIVLTIMAVLAVIYFVAPDVYTAIGGWIGAVIG